MNKRSVLPLGGHPRLQLVEPVRDDDRRGPRLFFAVLGLPGHQEALAIGGTLTFRLNLTKFATVLFLQSRRPILDERDRFARFLILGDGDGGENALAVGGDVVCVAVPERDASQQRVC